MDIAGRMTLDARGLLRGLQLRLKAIGDNAAIALTAISELPDRESLLAVPGVFMHTLFGDPPQSTSETRGFCTTWVVGAGLRDAMESFGLFCEEAWRCLLIATDGASGVVTFKKAIDLTGASLHDIADAVVGNAAKEIDRLGIAKKFNLFESRFGVKVSWRSEVESINQARNCLTHRLGVVATTDINDPAAGLLRVSFRASEIVVKGPDGAETRLTEPRVVEGGGSLGISMGIPRDRQFRRGDRIQFTAQEFMHLLNTVYRVAVEITDQVNAQIAKIGKPPPSDSGAAT